MKNNRIPNIILFGIQSILFYLYINNNISYLLFSILSSLILSISVYTTKTYMLLPIILKLNNVLNDKNLLIQLKLYYAVKAFIYSILGAAFYKMVYWFVKSILDIFSVLDIKDYSNIDLIIIKFKGIMHNIFLNQENYPLLLMALLSSFFLQLFNSYFKNKGPRKKIYDLYNKHKYKFVLFKQEKKSGTLYFGLGVSLNLYLQIIYLIFSAFGKHYFEDYEKWLRELLLNGNYLKNPLSITFYNLFEMTIISAIYWLPFIQIGKGYNIFIYFNMIPLVSCVLVFLLFQKESNSANTKDNIVRFIFMICWVFLGILQYINPNINPAIDYMLSNLSLFVKPSESFYIALVFFIKIALSVVYIFTGIQFLSDSEEKYRINNDPIGLYYNFKKKYFIYSILFRMSCISTYFYIRKFFDESIADRIIPVFFLIISSVFILMTQNNDQESFLKELKNSFSQEKIKESIKKWQNKIETKIKKRDIFNITYLCLTNIIILFFEPKKILIITSISSLIILYYYMLYTSFEFLTERKILGLEIKHLGINEKNVHFYTLGLSKFFKF